MAAINAILDDSTPDERAETYKARPLQALAFRFCINFSISIVYIPECSTTCS